MAVRGGIGGEGTRAQSRLDRFALVAAALDGMVELAAGELAEPEVGREAGDLRGCVQCNTV